MPETEEAVVEFGPDDDAPRAPGRRMPIGAFLAGLAGDRRLVPLAAALGAVALFGSLVSEWQLTVVDSALWGDEEAGSTRTLTTTVADLGGWSGGYLVGVLLLVATVVLTLFGPPAGRRYARLCALSVGGVLLALLAALASYLGDTSPVVGELNTVILDRGHVTLSHGRGIWCAAVGVALILLATVLAGRHQPAGPAPADLGSQAGAPGEAAVWSWRRPTGGEEEDGPPDAPFDLTVASAKPFTTSAENVDKPS